MQAKSRTAKIRSRIFVRHIAVPIEHGSWVFLFSPLLIGLFAGTSINQNSWLLIAAALAVFMLRQPLTVLVKIFSKRRPRTELSGALFWSGVYGLLAIGLFMALALRGYFELIYLALPAVPVFAWNSWLVSRRSERRKPLMEIAGSGVLALTAPAAYWVGTTLYHPVGWLLWGLTWMQAAVSILYAYLRLEQRVWPSIPSPVERWQAGRSVVLTAMASFLVVVSLSVFKIVPVWLPAAYVIQLGESVWGTFVPAVKVKPTQIGLRQLVISVLFTIAFILAWG